MSQLLRQEIRRFRRFVAGSAAVHLVLLWSQASLGSLYGPSSETLNRGLLSFWPWAWLATGILFGIAQWRPYRRSELWIFLLHRPLPPSRILVGMGGAAVLLLAVAVPLPLWLVTWLTDLGAGSWIDTRHYGLVAWSLGVTVTGYLAGIVVTLTPHRSRFVILLLPVLLLLQRAPGWWILLVLGIVLTWIGALVAASFTPDLRAAARAPLPLALLAVPIQYLALFGLGFLLLLGYSVGVVVQEHGFHWKGLAVHAWNDYFPEGTYDRSFYASRSEVLTSALRTVDTEHSSDLLASLDRDSVVELRPQWLTAARRHRPLPHDVRQTLWEPTGTYAYRFSHDQLRFERWHREQQTARGWLGVSGSTESSDPSTIEPFEGVLRVTSDHQVVTARRIYRYDSERDRFEVRFAGRPDELVITPAVRAGDRIAVLTDQRLYLLDADHRESGQGDPDSSAAIELPGVARNLLRVVVGASDRRQIVAFTFGVLSERDHLEARELLLEVDQDGRSTVLLDRELGQGPPAWARHRRFIVSPVLLTLHDLAWSAVGPEDQRLTWRDLRGSKPPSSVLGLATLAALLAATATAWLTRRRQVPRRQRGWWIAAGFLTGWPGFISCLLLMPRGQPPRGDPASSRALDTG